MGARDLLEALAGSGLSVSADGDRLLIRPASKLTHAMRNALREAKPELLAMIRAQASEDMAVDLPAVEGSDTEVALFQERRTRLMRWGWTERAATKLAERLVNRDRGHDERMSCTECQHYRPGRHHHSSRCGNHRNAGLSSPELGRDLAGQLQHCPGFQVARLSAVSQGVERRMLKCVLESPLTCAPGCLSG